MTVYFPYGKFDSKIPPNLNINVIVNGLSFIDTIKNFNPNNTQITPNILTKIVNNSMHRIFEQIFRLYYNNVPPFIIDDALISEFRNGRSSFIHSYFKYFKYLIFLIRYQNS